MRVEDKQLFSFLDTVIKADMQLTRMELIQLTGQFIGHGAEDVLIKKYAGEGWIYEITTDKGLEYGITKPGRAKHEELRKLPQKEKNQRLINAILFWSAVIAGITGIIAIWPKGC